MKLLGKAKWPLTIVCIMVFIYAFRQEKKVWLSSLDMTKMVQGWDHPMIDLNYNKTHFSVGKQVFEKGVGTRVKSYVWINLAGGSDKFTAYVGVDNDTTYRSSKGKHKFKITGDGKLLWQSGIMQYREEAKKVDVNLKGIDTLILEVINMGDNESNLQMDWGEAQFTVSGKLPEAISPPRGEEAILTPPAPKYPRINGPVVYGCRPGNPFLYRIPTTGVRPIQFKVQNLPNGLHLDPSSGIITGSVAHKGNYEITLSAKNKFGNSLKKFTIKCGDIIGLTPEMGWNDWYSHYNRINDKMMRAAADALINSGMADAGYQYVNIDDCWMNKAKDKDQGRVGPGRDANGNIIPNSYFPDMKGLSNYIHSKGLKAGLYSSPGPETCGGYTGSYQHEEQDAKQYADWGFDLLKYDWCSYGNTLNTKKPTSEMYRHPYQQMGGLLKQQKRDIIFNLCQYGWDKVWTWGFEAGGNSWRTGDDLGYGLNGLFRVAYKNGLISQWTHPGAFNDPDYIQIGYVGNAYEGGLPVHTNLTPNEQYAFMSMWCLLTAPLIYGSDVTKLDKFSLNVLCNPEVIAIDQDVLAKGAKTIPQTEETFLLVKNLDGGSKAIGLCNGGELPVKMKVTWAQASAKGKQMLRDPWRQKNIGVYDDNYTVNVPRHSVVLIKMKPAK